MERRLTAWLFVILLLSGAVHSAQAQSDAAKPPWLWTLDERIHKRVDPAERASRRARNSQRTIAPGFAPIDGSVEPELFLPVELVTRLALNTDAPHERMREAYRGAIKSHGWEYEAFWSEVHSAAAPYLSLMQQSGLIQRNARGTADLSELASQVCEASANLLEALRLKFGEQDFDRFLYREVAPHVRMSIADHADSPDSLRKKVKGCRQ